MREMVIQKMKECAAEWVTLKRNQDLIKQERGDQPIKGYNLDPLKPLAPFHVFFFERFDKEFAVFDKHTRRYMFRLIYATVESWENSGLCFWEKYRLSLTPEGEASFGAKAE